MMMKPILSNACGSVYEDHAVMNLKKNSVEFVLKEMESINLKSTFNGKLPTSTIVTAIVLLLLPLAVFAEFGISNFTIGLTGLALLMILLLLKAQIKYYVRVAYKDGRKWKIIIAGQHHSDARRFIQEVRRQRPQIKQKPHYFPKINLNMGEV